MILMSLVCLCLNWIWDLVSYIIIFTQEELQHFDLLFSASAVYKKNNILLELWKQMHVFFVF